MPLVQRQLWVAALACTDAIVFSTLETGELPRASQKGRKEAVIVNSQQTDSSVGRSSRRLGTTC